MGGRKKGGVVKIYRATLLATLLFSALGVMAQDVVPKHLQLARDFVANTKPENNDYTNSGRFTRMPGEKGATDYVVHADCVAFVEDMFKRTSAGVPEQIPTQKFKNWHSIHDYVPAMDAEAGFTKITKVEDLCPGDVIAWLFIDMKGHRHDGHIAFIDTTPMKIKSRPPHTWSSAPARPRCRSPARGPTTAAWSSAAAAGRRTA